ncbi:MAG: single-stranded DNA-binding protein [Planctomycetota bacterium]
MNFNKVILVGRLTRDVEVKYLGSGMAVTDLGLAVNHNYRRQDGEMVEETCFVDCTVWGKQAESCSQYLSKGRGVLVEGRLKLETWETDGQKRSKHKVSADRVQFMPRSAGGGGQEGGGVSDYGNSYSQPRSSHGGGGGGQPSPGGNGGGGGDFGGGSYHDDNVPF